MKQEKAFSDLSSAVNDFFANQLRHWELARINYTDLNNIRTRTIHFKGFQIIIQFNPKRIISSAAKVDPVSIQARPCFLCENNRPAEQQSIRYRNDYSLLVNPYPIFPGHLTIPSLQHELQRILPKFGFMLKIAKDLPDYAVIYNGPHCGASAPDHFHFQAVPRQNIPVEADFTKKTRCIYQLEKQGVKVFTWESYLRKMITMSGDDPVVLTDHFHTVYHHMAQIIPSGDEPMLNILAWYNLGHYVIHLIPRKLHRPDRYFASGAGQLLVSPASIDLGGVLIVPREEDFVKINQADIIDVFRQVCVDDELIQYLVTKIS
jgi:diadenosine tetraphosphate (Ap4A) HIT family hydrolase